MEHNLDTSKNSPYFFYRQRGLSHNQAVKLIKDNQADDDARFIYELEIKDKCALNFDKNDFDVDIN